MTTRGEVVGVTYPSRHTKQNHNLRATTGVLMKYRIQLDIEISISVNVNKITKVARTTINTEQDTGLLFCYNYIPTLH